MDLFDWLTRRNRHLLLTHVGESGALAPLHALLAERFGDLSPIVFDHRDQALEWAESRLIAGVSGGRDLTRFSLAALNIFAGLGREELKLLEAVVRPLVFERGQTIVREGDAANLFFAVARGTATIRIKAGEKIVRIASVGPGVTFGEMALIDGGRRSADVVADERVICYGFSVEQLKEIGREYPNLITTILANMMRDFSERLRRANDEVRALEE